MKKIVLLSTLLISSIGYSQTDLYISDNETSYVYVDGTAFSDAVGSNVAPLFVTNDIQLAGPDSAIYLRNEAQLLQSNSEGNLGTGELSVYQEGNVTAYEYNYWCSPIGSRDDTTISNPFGVRLLNDVVDERTSIPAIIAALPGRNGLSTPLSIEQRWIYTYTNPSNLYSNWNLVANTIAIMPGEGFTMKGTLDVLPTSTEDASSQRYDFRGKPNTGTFIASVGAPIGPLAEDAQQTLVGNPYPSAMDAVAYLYDPVNINAIDTALYYWEQAAVGSHNVSDYVGGYGTYTVSIDGSMSTYVPATFQSYDGAGNPTGEPGGSVSKEARRYIPIGQGFMVQGNIMSTGTVRTTNSMRVFYKETSADSEFFRASSTSSQTNISDHNDYGYSIVSAIAKRFRLNVEFNNTYKRQLVQNFHPSATDGFDRGLEAKSPGGVSSDASWILDNKPFCIQAFNFNEDLKIPLALIVSEQQPIGFSMFDIQNFEESQAIFIHDIETGIYVNLRSQNYQINLPAGDYPNRFEITFKNEETLGTDEVTSGDFTIIQDNNLAQLTIVNSNQFDVKQITLFDAAGKQILNVATKETQSKYHVSTKGLSDGIYIASITLNSDKVISKKVLVKN